MQIFKKDNITIEKIKKYFEKVIENLDMKENFVLE